MIRIVDIFLGFIMFVCFMLYCIKITLPEFEKLYSSNNWKEIQGTVVVNRIGNKKNNDANYNKLNFEYKYIVAGAECRNKTSIF